MRQISGFPFVLTALLAGCDPAARGPGPDTTSATPGWHGPVGTLESPVLTSPSAKVVVKRAQTVWAFVTEYDGSTDTTVKVPCTTDPDCSAFAGASCQALFCQHQVLDTSTFYVGNLGSPYTILIPCDGNAYVAEIYGATSAIPHVINATEIRRTSAPFVFPSGCAPAPAPTWDAIAVPSLTLPATIYVGLGSPWDRYSVHVEGLAAPWSTSKWSLTASGATPTNTGNPAMFTAPTSGAADISFQSKFHLDGSLLLTGETTTSWELNPAAVTRTPLGSGGITP